MLTLSPRARLALYILSGVGTLVVGYLFTKGWIGEPEVALWGGFVALVNGLSAVNVDFSDTAARARHAAKVARRSESGAGEARMILIIVAALFIAWLLVALVQRL